jgi:hypothetical protein
MQRYNVYFIWKLLYTFRVVPPPIVRSANNCIYSIWYLSHSYCCLPLSWKSGNCSSNSSTIAADSSNGVTNIRCCRNSCLSSWWWVLVPPETCRAVARENTLGNVAFCWIYIGIYRDGDVCVYVDAEVFSRFIVKRFLTLSDPTSDVVRQYNFPVLLRCRKTSDTIFVAFVRPLSEPVRRVSSCSTDFSQQIAQVVLFLFLHVFLF